MANIILLYKLKPEITPQQFETWLRDTDFPAMRALRHIKSFVTYRVQKRVMAAEAPSVHYVEVFNVPDLTSFIAEDLAAEKTKTVMGEFRTLVEDPEYLVAEPVV